MKNMLNLSIRTIAAKLYIKLYSGNSDTVAMHTRSFRMGVVTGLLLIAGLLPMIAAAQPTSITLSVDPAEVTESSAATTITITATLVSGRFGVERVLFFLSTASGTATAGNDFTAVPLTTLTIPANMASGTATFPFTAAMDADDEAGGETVFFGGSLLLAGSTNTSDNSVSVTAATLTINDPDTAPAFASGAVINDLTYFMDQMIMPLTLLTVATAGNGTTTYTLSPTIPGLTLNPATGELTGTPTTAAAATMYNYIASDADDNTTTGDTDRLLITITVTENSAPDFGTASIADQAFLVNTPVNLTLPVVTGGSGDVRIDYALNPPLPTGLDFNAALRPPTITGTPTAAATITEYTYTATDGDANTADTDTDMLTFSITVGVEDTAPAFAAGAMVPAQSYTQDTEIMSLTLPTATGGNGTITYTLTPDIPGLTLHPTTHVLSGTPTTVAAATMYTYTAGDSDGSAAGTDEATLTFRITVAAPDTAPSFGGATIPNQSYIINQMIEPLTLPRARGGNGALTHSLPSMPAGLDFNSSTLVLSGTPTAVGTALYGYTVIDSDDNAAGTDGDRILFRITVSAEENFVPAFVEGAAIPDQTYTQGVAIERLTLPAATGGNGALTHNLLDVGGNIIADLSTVIPGLTLNTVARTITGTPSMVASLATYFWTADDEDEFTGLGDNARLRFTITVTAAGVDTAPTFGGTTIADQSYIINQMIEPLTLPEATGGNGALTHSLLSLPAGLDFNPTTLELTGTPTALNLDGAVFSYTVVDSDANSAGTDGDRILFRITVTAAGVDIAPTFGGATIDDQTYPQGTEITLTLPVVTGGNGAITYSLADEAALPTGLSFNGTARPPTITGRPSAVAASMMFTYTAADGDDNMAADDLATLTFTITVTAAPDTAPTFGGAMVPAQSYTQGTEITSLTLPVVTGGNGAITYTLTPALPTGLNFNGTTRPPTITGTPGAVAASMMFTYTAADGDDNMAADDAASLTFTITVTAVPDTAPTFGGATIDDQTYTQGTAIETLTLPEATGGDGTITYTLTPAIPAGLSFDAATRDFTGTPTTVAAAADYTYTATDADDNMAADDAATLTFTITVSPMVLGIDDLTDGTFNIYPNPVSGSLTVERKGIAGNEISIHDLTGKRIQVPLREQSPRKVVLDVSGLAGGMYLVKVSGRLKAGDSNGVRVLIK